MSNRQDEAEQYNNKIRALIAEERAKRGDGEVRVITPNLQVPKVATVSIEGIRNYANTVSVPLGRGLTIIYAENGVGKTTLVDALELAESGQTSRAISSAGATVETRDKSTLPTWGNSYSDIEVSVVSDDGEVWGFSGGEIHRTDNSPHPKFYNVVSRRSIRRVVDTKPSDRFEFLASLTSYVDGEHQFAAMGESIGKFKSFVKEEESYKKELESDLDGTGFTLDSVTPALIAGDQEVEEQRKRTSNAASRFLRSYSTFEKTVSRIKSLYFPVAPEELNPEVPISSEFDAQVISFIKNYVVNLPEDSLCPVCQETILTAEKSHSFATLLQEHAQYVQRLSEYESNVKTAQAWKDFWNGVSSIAVEYREVSSDLMQKICEIRVVDTHSGEAELEEISKVVDELGAIARRYGADTASYDRTRMIDFLSELGDLEESFSALASSINARAVGVVEDLSRGRPAVFDKWWTACSSDTSVLEKMLLRVNAVDGYKELVSGLERDIAELKALYLANSFAPLEDLILKWWSKVRPSSAEGLTLEIDIPTKNKSNSLNIYCRPCGSPRNNNRSILGVFSDSQLDAFAMAVRLAQHEKEFGNGLLWLDDPSDSLDSHSMERFANNVIPEIVTNGGQLVIVTHDAELVKKCWLAVRDCGNDLGFDYPAALQVDLELDGSSSASVRLSPHDWVSAKIRVEGLLREIGSEGREGKWKISNRLLLANSLRIYSEFLLADGLDYVRAVLSGTYAMMGTSAARNRTLADYKSDFLAVCNDLRQVMIGLPVNEGRLDHVKRCLDDLADAAASIDNSILNSGSHASSHFPTFDELKELKRSLDRRFNIIERGGVQVSMAWLRAIIEDEALRKYIISA